MMIMDMSIRRGWRIVHGSLGGTCTAVLMLMLVVALAVAWPPQLRWRRLNRLCSLLAFIPYSEYCLTSIIGATPHFTSFPLPPLTISFLCQPCPPFHIWHMVTLGQIVTCTLRTTLHHNTPLLIHQQPSLGSTSLPQAPSYAPQAPPPARRKYSLERVSSTGSYSIAGVSGYVGSGYVRSVFQYFLLLISNPLLGYYVIAIILSVITALVTIYHRQIVAQLTPAAHTVKRSVVTSISS